MEQHRTKYSHVNWDKHELIVKELEGVLIHHLQKPNSVSQNVKFTNTGGVLVVTGDYGNWIFCREFHPSEEGFVSGGYWCEKLQIASTQEPYEMDSDAIIEELHRMVKEGAAEYGWEGNELEEMKEYYTNCLDYAEESKEIYQAFAHQNYPSFTDYECVVYLTDYKVWLKCVFDAFNEICRRLEKENQKEEEVAEAAQ